jgi:hypothetical protein
MRGRVGRRPPSAGRASHRERKKARQAEAIERFNGAPVVLAFAEYCEALKLDQERVWEAALVHAPRGCCEGRKANGARLSSQSFGGNINPPVR